MLRFRFRGALARAHITAVLLAIALLFVLLPQAHASPGACRAHWPEIPGDAYRLGRAPACHAVWSAQPAFDPDPNASPELVLPRRGVAALVAAKAMAVGVPVSLALAIARFESGLHMFMHGAAGERGAMQVLPQTARQIGVGGNLYGPAGIEAGVRYLKLAIALHRRDGWCPVASAYNTGVWRESRCTSYGRAVVAMAGRP